ncbi:hypothetical protein JKP88DRAFT_288657 [Tribonema minus]|uniref:Uncharacterized protein n=1 Tax=Tribonema minus TaxID=303371 RepID=A0A836CKD1_9STRA|nr:hypothetical protein JKP88DRAFT_288657 [Tribonema minus]
MKLLHWHKLANEAALKAAILKTRKAKQGGGAGEVLKPAPPASANHMPMEEKAAWVQQIIEEEKGKPLQVGKDFVMDYEKREKEQSARLDREIERQIASLRKLREHIATREEMRSRRSQFRTIQAELQKEKAELMQGRLATPKEQGILTTGGAEQPANEEEQITVAGALNTVLGSLGKLVELEARITNLETNNVYDEYCADEKNSHYHHRHQQRTPSSTALGFSKRRTEASLAAPSKSYYAVVPTAAASSSARRGPPKRARAAAASGHLSTPTVRVTGGSTWSSRAAASGRRSAPLSRSNTTMRASVGRMATSQSATFLTAVPEARRRVSGSAAQEKRRAEARRKAAREQAEAARLRRQDAIISEWIKQRQQRTAGPRSNAPQPRASTKLRRSSSSSNPHMEQFRDMRAQHAKRKEELLRGGGGGSAAPTRSTSKAAANSTWSRSGGGGGARRGRLRRRGG